MIIDKKLKLGSKVTLRKSGKTKVDSELSVKADNSAKRKRVEDAIGMSEGDERLSGTCNRLADVLWCHPFSF